MASGRKRTHDEAAGRKPPGPRASPPQIELLLCFMGEHPEIAATATELSPGLTVARKNALWAELVRQLNAVGPAIKSRADWQHFWARRVRNAKARCADFRSNSG